VNTRTAGANGRRTLLSCLTALALVCTSLVGLGAAPARAADLTRFDPGLIISDAVFYDTSTMDAAGIQAFLDRRNPSCVDGPMPCLRSYTETTVDRVATARCPGGYRGRTNETAAQIIAAVATSCGINPQVLVVMLQKEQGLVTASGSSLTASRYRNAMGYACPDNGTCNPAFAGFANQVYSAAAQLRNYAQNPQNFGHKAGQLNPNVRYHPNAACGGSAVFIQNQATASLYNYTPYQPNAAALAAGYGTGDACSAYGNRNFYNYFNDWFGPSVNRLPGGFVDEIAPAGLAITVRGWARDPDTDAAIAVHVYVDGAGVAWNADVPRGDVGRHGYSGTIPATAGVHTVCVYAIDAHAGPNTLLRCQTVTVVNNAPGGFVDEVSASGSAITVRGWARDPDSTAPIPVHVYVDGAGVAWNADVPRADVGRHGYSGTIPASPGNHTVCVYAIDAHGGPNTLLRCQTVAVVNNAPGGRVDEVTAVGSQIRVRGWARDPDTTAPIPVHVYVDGAGVAWNADVPRGDVGPHSYAGTLPAAPGRHTVCVYAIDATGGPNSLLGCTAVTVAGPVNTLPGGVVDEVTAVGSEIRVRGWARDPDTTAPIPVHVYVDGVGQAWTANIPRGDVGPHSFAGTIPAAPGRHTVCVYAIDSAGGPNPLLGCTAVTVSAPANAAPVGVVDQLAAVGSQVVVAGWARDPDTDAPIAVHVYVDGVGQAWTADVARPDVGRHGFTGSVAATPGTHTVCVYGIDSAGGLNSVLRCASVTVA
jgi:hypothetical protein